MKTKTLLAQNNYSKHPSNWTHTDTESCYPVEDTSIAEPVEHILWDAITSRELIKKELNIIRDEIDLIFMKHIASLLELDMEKIPPRSSNKIEAPQIPKKPQALNGKNSNPPLVPVNDLRNQSCVASLYQLERTSRTPPKVPPKPARLSAKTI